MTKFSSPNFSNGQFRNQVSTLQISRPAFASVFREYFLAGNERFPRTPPVAARLNRDSFGNEDSSGLSITWLGHSSVVVEIDDHTILIDPMLSLRASPFSWIGPKRFHRDCPLSSEELPPIDAVLISHDHYDHLDRATITAVHPKTARFFVPLGIGRLLAQWGVPAEKLTELDWWQSSQNATGLQFIAAPARHFSGRGLFRNQTLWSSWIIVGPRHRVFFSGDGGYSRAFKEVGAKYGPFDVTMIEAGQYNRIWPSIHMMPEESVQAHLDVGGKVMLPIHWSTFNLSLHSWTEPVERVLKAAAAHKVKVATPMAGEQLHYDSGQIPSAVWWK